MPLLQLGYDFDEAIKRQKISRKEIQELRESNASLAPKDMTDEQLALFLDSCGGVDEARKVIQIYYTVRNTSPEHFKNRIPSLPEIQQCFDNQDYFYLPPAPNGYPIIFHGLSNSKSGNYIFDEAIKTFFMTIDVCLYKLGPRPGIIFIFDMKHVRITHLTRVSIGSIKKFFHYLQDGLPGKLCQIHVINVVSFFDKIISMIKPFMRAEIFKALYTYPQGMDLEEFHKKWIPKECLPSDLGGDLPTISEMHNSFRQDMIELSPYFIAEEEQRQRALPTNNNNNNKKSNGKTEQVTHQFSKLEFD